MSAGMAETGTETSCLRLAPWRRCASGTDSRNFHMAWACAIELASMASLIVPAAAASSRVAVNRVEQALARIRRAEFDEQVPGRVLT